MNKGLTKFGHDTMAKVKRYGLPEAVGTATTYLGYKVVDHLADSPVLSAYAAVMCENFGFYGTMAIQQITADAREAMRDEKPYGVKELQQTVRDLLKEFVGSEFLDTLIVRPLTIGVGEKLLGNSGIVIGKWLADAIFFVVSHETRKKIEKNK